MENSALEILPLWTWPATVCLLALAVRIWVRGKQGGALPRNRVSGAPWQRALEDLRQRMRVAPHRESPAVEVLARKAIGPQHTIVLLAVWDQEIALSVQPGVTAAVLASRQRTGVAAVAEQAVPAPAMERQAGREQYRHPVPGSPTLSPSGESPCV